MQNDVLLDSDVIIWILRGKQEIIEKAQKLFSIKQIHTTPISAAEIHAGLRHDEVKFVNDFFRQIVVTTITYEIGCVAGEFLKKYSKSHGVEMGDALIAASAAALV